MRASFFFLLIFWIYLLPAQAQSEFIGLKDSIQAIVDSSHGGAQIAIFSKDKILWQENFGWADEANAISVTDSTYFRIGSITKMFVAIAALQLIEQGKLQLDDRLIEVAPEIAFQNKWRTTHPIQIKHLLEHTTGFDDIHLVEYATQGDGWTSKEGLDFHTDSRYARWQPGLFSSYCNSGPAIVAYIIEKITGQTFEEYAATNIFQPLGMSHSSFVKTPFLEQHLAKGYTPEGQEAAYWQVILRPAGSINSNIQEMISFGQMLLGRGERDSAQILSTSSIDRMEISRTTLAGKAGLTDGYGLHNYTTNYKGLTFHGHNGGMIGFSAELQYSPDLDIGFINLTNASGSALPKINDELYQVIYEQFQGRISNPPITATFNDDFLGYYVPATTRNQMMNYLISLLNVIQVGKNEQGYFAGSVLTPDKDSCSIRTANTLTLTSRKGYQSPFYFGEYEDKVYAQYINEAQNFRKASPFQAFLPMVLALLFVLFLLLFATHSLIWIFRKVLGHALQGQWSVRLAALLSMAGFIGFIAANIVGNTGDVLQNLGTASPTSIGIFISSIALGLGLLVFCWSAVKTEVGVEKSWFRVLSLLSSLVFIITFLYLYKEGVIGLRTWVY